MSQATKIALTDGITTLIKGQSEPGKRKFSEIYSRSINSKRSRHM